MMEKILDQATDLMRRCGQIILTADRGHTLIDEKEGRGNFVTSYDRKVQAVLKEGLHEIFPEAAFVGEEDAIRDYHAAEYSFVVDPIDGTTNFIRDMHHSAVSVALMRDGQSVAGAVFDPYTDEMYTAIRGKGACLNGAAIHVSPWPLEEGIILVGTAPYNASLHTKSMDLASRLLDIGLDIRRRGSAALDLCTIAAGRAEVFFEYSLAPWDHAAGGLIVTEAGGFVTRIGGGEPLYDGNCSILAVNGAAKEEVWRICEGRA